MTNAKPDGTGTSAAARTVLLMMGAWALPAVVAAQGFSASVSPPRVELQAKAGQTVRQVLDINHAALSPGRYRVYTNDWVYQKDGSVAFGDDLTTTSCRPWAALERRELNIAPRSRHRFRMEVTVPPLSPNGECRFAVMVEGVDPVQVQQEGLSMPVTGRIAVIVYVAVGGATPNLRVTSHKVAVMQGATQPVLEISNDGNATGRFEGVLEGVDADGRSMELMPANMPILPGEQRAIVLSQLGEDGKALPPLRFPLKVKGSLEVGKQRLPLNLTFTQP